MRLRTLVIALPWSIAAASVFVTIWTDTHIRYEVFDITSPSNCGNGRLAVIVLDKTTGKVTINKFVDEDEVQR